MRLGQARFGDDVILDFVASDTLDVGSLEILIEDPVRPGRGYRPRRAQTVIVLTDVDLLSPHVQRRLARRLDDGFVPIAATTRRTSEQLRGSGYQDRVRIGLGPAILETGGRLKLPRGATP